MRNKPFDQARKVNQFISSWLSRTQKKYGKNENNTQAEQ